MQIEKISQHPSFGDLFINVKPEDLKSNAVRSQLGEIKNIFKENKFDKKRWVDVILNYNKEEGFYGVISSKEQGTPNNPHYRHSISTDKKVISSFKKWLNDWNHSYSPAVIKKLEALQEDALRATGYYLRNGNNNKK